MIDFSQAIMRDIVIHHVGNKTKQEGVRLSNELTNHVADEAAVLFSTYLLQPFRKAKQVYQFSHGTDLRFNEVYVYVSRIFSNQAGFLEQSAHIANHLYESTNHPRIRSGEFYMVYFEQIQIQGESVEAIGMFRTENKETYLKVVEQENRYEIQSDVGIQVDALDKGCIVLNRNAEAGYEVYLVDKHADKEARYWREDFLCVRPIPTEETATDAYLGLVDRFLRERVSPEDKMKPAEIQSQTVTFFEENDTFQASKYEKEVFREPDVIEAFQSYKTAYETEQGEETPSEFPITPTTVKAAKRKMRSVLKLDSSFTIYLRNLSSDVLSQIERGEDSHKGMQYYKIYFREEH